MEEHFNQNEQTKVLQDKIKKARDTCMSSFPIIMEYTTQLVSFLHTTFSHKLNPQNSIPSDIKQVELNLEKSLQK